MHGRAYGDVSERNTLYHEDELESLFKPGKAVTQHTRDCVREDILHVIICDVHSQQREIENQHEPCGPTRILTAYINFPSPKSILTPPFLRPIQAPPLVHRCLVVASRFSIQARLYRLESRMLLLPDLDVLNSIEKRKVGSSSEDRTTEMNGSVSECIGAGMSS